MSNKKTNNKPANNQISLFGEMSMMSVAAIVCLIILVIGCVAFYLYMLFVVDRVEEHKHSCSYGILYLHLHFLDPC